MSKQSSSEGQSGASPLTGGLFPIVESDSLEKLRENHTRALDDAKQRGQVWEKHKEEYTNLKSVLSTLHEKTTHQTMVPLGSKAYMEGTLVHANEIMVLLGENWFAERSTKQASEICERRIASCDEMMSKLNEELRLIQVQFQYMVLFGSYVISHPLFSCVTS